MKSNENRNIKYAEDKVIEYYEKQEMIKQLKSKIKKSDEYIKDIQTKISGCNIKLSTDIKGSSFGDIGCGSGNTKHGPIEQSIENYYLRLESYQKELEDDITVYEEKIIKLNTECLDMFFILDALDDEAKRFMELKYGKKRSNVYIGKELSKSRANIYRLKEQILNEILNRLLIYCE